jgi:sugar phosphate isomerase/epimerase
VASAWQVVRLADRPNGGLNVDTWHCARTGTTPEDLRALPGDRVLAIQLDDAPLEAEANLIDATLHDRLLPGEGALDLAGYVGALRDIGVDAPVGVEVFSDELHARGARAAARAAADATRVVLDGAAWPGP